jgi:broad specificity phosphatase PhoE
MRIALIRHGETDWNRAGKMQGWEDVPLNETGKKQAAETAAFLTFLKEYSWREIVSSPLSRARQTAEIIAEKTGIAKISVDAGFIERNLGSVSGMLVQEFDRAYPDGVCSAIEPWETLQTRMSETLLKYAEMFQNRDFIAVSHGWGIKALMSLYNPNANAVLKNGGVMLLHYENSRFSLQTISI